MLIEDILKSLATRTLDTPYGISTARRSIASMEPCLSGGLCPTQIFKIASADLWAKELIDADSRLTYCNADMANPEHIEKSIRDGADITPHCVLEYDCILSSRSRDRDRDIIDQKGGLDIDTKMPLLWQHIQVQPIGKHVAVLSQDDQYTKCRFAIADTELGRDAATLARFGALRKSHGFRPSEFVPVEIVKGSDGKDVVRGWHIKRAACMEGSLVSIPANPDTAIIATYAKEFDGVATSFSKGLLKNQMVKSWAQTVYDSRPTMVAVGAPAPAEAKHTDCTCQKGGPARVPAGNSDGGQFASGSGGSAIAGKTSDDYRAHDHKCSTIKVDSHGQIKLKKPKDKAQAVEQLNAMGKILDMAKKAAKHAASLPKNDKEKVMANLRENHAVNQMKRSLGFAKSLLDTKSKDDLRELIDDLSAKYGIEPESEPADSDPELKAVELEIALTAIELTEKTMKTCPDCKKTYGEDGKCKGCGKSCEKSAGTGSDLLEGEACPRCKSGKLDSTGTCFDCGYLLGSNGKSLLSAGLTDKAFALTEKMYGSNPYPAGSWEAIQFQLRKSATGYLKSQGVDISEYAYVDLAATYTDSAVVCYSSNGMSKCWSIGYTMADGSVKWAGPPAEVEIQAVIVAKMLADLPQGLAVKAASDAVAKHIADHPTPAAPAAPSQPTITELSRRMAAAILTADGSGGEVGPAVETIRKAFATLKQHTEAAEIDSILR